MSNDVAIITGPEPDLLVSHAAQELSRYLQLLFGLDQRTFTTIAVARQAGTRSAIVLDPTEIGRPAPVDPQEYVLQRLNAAGVTCLLTTGGSPAATLWAVYDLVERWGVQYLLTGDILPDSVEPFHLPQINVRHRPRLRTRGVRLINLFPMGLESWGLIDIQRYLDQLAKLRFNSVYHELWCWQPYLHYECEGWSKCTAEHWFGWHYPIDEETIGRRHFGSLTEFVPPDFAGCCTYRERIEVGEQLIHDTLEHAVKRGFHTQIKTVLTDFPTEFSHFLGMPPLARAFGRALAGGHKSASDGPLQQLITAVLRAYVNTYPQVEQYVISMPEFAGATSSYETSWDRLNDKYGLSKLRTLDQILEEASRRTDYPEGAGRVVAANKGDIIALDLFDQLLKERRILDDTSKPDADVCLAAINEELIEVYAHMNPGATLVAEIDYTASRIAKRPEALLHFSHCNIKPLLTMTTQDDNIGVVPQNTTGSVHELTEMLCRYEWEGFQLRYWMISDMEPVIAYLAEACWHPDITPTSAYRKHIATVAGSAAVEPMLAALELLDHLTTRLGDHGLGFAFPVPTMGVERWYRAEPLSDELLDDRDLYKQILQHADRARAKAEWGHGYLDYFVGRVEFGVLYLDLMDMVGRAGKVFQQRAHQEAIALLQDAVLLARTAVETHAGIARSTDLGTLAQLNEDLYRKLKGLLDEVRNIPSLASTKI